MPGKECDILLIEPFFGGSHRRWAEELKEELSLSVEFLTLPARHWKWRMHGAAVTLAQQFLESEWNPKLILATDMLDLGVFLSLTRVRTSTIPVVLYFHENQITYPWSEQDRDLKKQRNHHYGFINYTSSLAADHIWFNSKHHQNAFLEELPKFLHLFPDYSHPKNVEVIRDKSCVVPIGIKLDRLGSPTKNIPKDEPLILWNHRWEYDKNPEEFFRLIHDLDTRSFSFRLAILGERTDSYPVIFDQIKESLAHRIDHWGYVEDAEHYLEWLKKADLLPVTSKQDFFGISTVEAMACDTYPLLPNRLAFPEHLKSEVRSRYLYENYEDLLEKMSHLLDAPIPDFSYQKDTIIASYDWKQIAAQITNKWQQITRK